MNCFIFAFLKIGGCFSFLGDCYVFVIWIENIWSLDLSSSFVVYVTVKSYLISLYSDVSVTVGRPFCSPRFVKRLVCASFFFSFLHFFIFFKIKGALDSHFGQMLNCLMLKLDEVEARPKSSL